MDHERVVVTRIGGPEVLRVIAEPAPEPGQGEVRVRVLAAGVSFGDVLLRLGAIPGHPKPPFTPGYDVVGVVDEVGSGVTSPGVGEMVGALLDDGGGYAEYVCLPAERLVPVPPGVDPAETIAVALNYFIAYQMLHRVAAVRYGERVLVHGAAGGVGTAFLQLGGLAGLEMYGTASRPKHDMVSDLGSHPDRLQERRLRRAGQGVWGRRCGVRPDRGYELLAVLPRVALRREAGGIRHLRGRQGWARQQARGGIQFPAGDAAQISSGFAAGRLLHGR